MEPLDSGHQIDVEIILNGILTVFEKCSLQVVGISLDIGQSI